MLCLSRKLKQAVTITIPDGRRIRIIVAEIDRGKIQLGFECDRDIKILRDELLPDEMKTAAPDAA